MPPSRTKGVPPESGGGCLVFRKDFTLMKTVVINSDDLSYAAEVILRGGLVAVPTDTVYGLAANGLDADAVEKIYEVKGRPHIKPIILLVQDLSSAEVFCSEIPENARILAEAFWPGALSLVLPHSDIVPDIVTAGGKTVGVRCPDHPKALDLLRLSGVPLAAPSANVSGMPSPKSAEEVLTYFDGKIDCVIDGGISALSFESTIVDFAEDPFRIIRQGALPEEEILRALDRGK